MTNSLVVLLSSFVGLLGLATLVHGLVPQADRHRRSTPAGPSRLQRAAHAWRGAPRRWRMLVIAAVIGGILGFALTGWVVLLVAVPAAVLGLPWLLSTPPNRELVLLQALDQWVRLLNGSILTGKSVGDAIRATRRQSPEALKPAIQTAVSRMDGRWSTSDALRAMADELDAPEADAVIAALMLASQRGGTGTSDTLLGIAEATQDRLRAMREVEAERAKPRIVVRQVTMITLTVLGVALVVGGGYFAPYGSALGQTVLAVLLASFVGSLVVLRQRTMPRRRERILVAGQS
ncbi:type II secretion system F family protein [Propionibacteriaceae bacterium G1746]